MHRNHPGHKKLEIPAFLHTLSTKILEIPVFLSMQNINTRAKHCILLGTIYLIVWKQNPWYVMFVDTWLKSEDFLWPKVCSIRETGQSSWHPAHSATLGNTGCEPSKRMSRNATCCAGAQDTKTTRLSCSPEYHSLDPEIFGDTWTNYKHVALHPRFSGQRDELDEQSDQWKGWVRKMVAR